MEIQFINGYPPRISQGVYKTNEIGIVDRQNPIEGPINPDETMINATLSKIQSRIDGYNIHRKQKEEEQKQRILDYAQIDNSDKEQAENSLNRALDALS